MTETTGNGKLVRSNGSGQRGAARGQGFWGRLRGLFGARNGDQSLRDALEEIITEIGENGSEDEAAVPIGDDERVMLANILGFRHLTVYDVMVPRADIVAVPHDISRDELVEVITQAGHSRLPVFQETLDDTIGMVHIRDLIPSLRRDAGFDLVKICREVLFVAPSMRVLDLLLEMRRSRVHMALVVDEFGGIDGLITIEDLVEEIVGEIEDEHDVGEGPKLTRGADGSLLADARATIEEFEEEVGPILTDHEREEDIDTLGGLVFWLADRVPARGELIRHEPSGVTFEVVQADPRRIKRLRLRNLPQRREAASDDGR